MVSVPKQELKKLYRMIEEQKEIIEAYKLQNSALNKMKAETISY